MSTEVTCPNCGNATNALQTLDPAIRAKLAEEGKEVPANVCANCYAQLAGGVARGSVLMAREKAREQRKMML